MSPPCGPWLPGEYVVRAEARLLGRRGTVLEEVTEAVLVERGDAELLRLRQLRAGALADHDVAGLLRHAAGDLAAARLELGLRLFARHRRQRAGEHEGHPLERGDVGAHLRLRRTLDVDPGLDQPTHEVTV